MAAVGIWLTFNLSSGSVLPRFNGTQILLPFDALGGVAMSYLRGTTCNFCTKSGTHGTHWTGLSQAIAGHLWCLALAIFDLVRARKLLGFNDSISPGTIVRQTARCWFLIKLELDLREDVINSRMVSDTRHWPIFFVNILLKIGVDIMLH
jgi:hypothetical protein